jgi:hypothetical protein
VDYRRLKDVTKKRRLPASKDQRNLGYASRGEVVVYIGLEKRIFALHPNDKEKTAFSTVQGLWQFTVVPFGLCNATLTFERLLESVLRGLTTMPVWYTWKTSSFLAALFKNNFITCGMCFRGYEKHT